MSKLIVHSIKNNPAFEGLASYKPDIVYSTAQGLSLKLHLLLPQAALRPEGEGKVFPCIVFVQGSAWTFPDITYELPQMSEFARNGYVVAMVTHRSALDGFQTPAFLEDVKTAIRFLRANAAEYRIDPTRIGIWGTSSGGNTALLVGLTGDDPAYRTSEYPELSDKVKMVVDCFGPADVPALFEATKHRAKENPEDGKLLYGLFGTDEEKLPEKMDSMNPVAKIKDGVEYPPFLLIHGDKDELVPYLQSVDMAERLCAAGVHTELIQVEGAEHEGSFWSRELLSMIADYIGRTL